VRLLLDTHVLFWWFVEPDRLSAAAFAAIECDDAEVYVSVASCWEMAIKVGIGKWPEAAALVDIFDDEVLKAEFFLLPISIAHVRSAGLMTSPHRDPFDRLLAAQAIIENLSLVTADPKLATLGATVLW
jgi:PIN domain nuclease of toxin-antitoxin system